MLNLSLNFMLKHSSDLFGKQLSFILFKKRRKQAFSYFTWPFFLGLGPVQKIKPLRSGEMYRNCLYVW